MPYRSLADFLEHLELDGELARVAAEVDPLLEVAEITRRVARSGGPALLFQNVRGRHTAIATNLLGSRRRICRALGVPSLEPIAARVAELVQRGGAPSWLERLKPGGGGSGVDHWQPKLVKTGLCQQVIQLGRDVDLNQLPALRSWPQEEAAWFSAQVFTRDAQTEDRSINRYELQVVDRNRLAILWRPQQKAASHFESYHQQNEKMPVAISLGGDPVWSLATGSALAEELDAFLFAGLLRDQPLELVKCRTVDQGAPADADFIIEGIIDPAEPLTPTGPRAADSGYYGLPQEARVIHVSAITERANPIFPATVSDGWRGSGDSPGERFAVHQALERILLPLVKIVVPELADLNLPMLGGGNSFGFFAIRKRYPQHVRKVASAIWGWAPLMHIRVVVLVDEAVDVHDATQVWSQVGANSDPGRDIFFHQGPPDPGAHAAATAGLGHSLAIDATSKLPGERSLPWPDRLTAGDEIIERVKQRWDEYGIEARRAD